MDHPKGRLSLTPIHGHAGGPRHGGRGHLSEPIGQGPRASVITDALAREGIVDAGPRIARYDSGFISPITRKFGPGETETITGMPRDAWDEVIRTLGPSDVLYIDAGIETNPPVLAAAEHALAHLPQHVRVIQDMSGAFIGPRNVRNDSVLTVLDQRSVQPLGERFMSDRTAFDASRVPHQAASFILSLFERSALISTTMYESFLARPRHATDKVSKPRTRFPAPTVVSTDHDGSYSVWTGALAATLAQRNTIERSIVLANCAGALASTMPGPSSCPTREQIEAAARTLTERDDVELERRTHAYEALAWVAVADAVALPVRGMSSTQIERHYKTRRRLMDADASHPTMPARPPGRSRRSRARSCRHRWRCSRTMVSHPRAMPEHVRVTSSQALATSCALFRWASRP